MLPVQLLNASAACHRACVRSKDPKIQNIPEKTYRARDERGEVSEDDSWPWAGRRVSKLPLLALSGWSFDTCHVALLHLRFRVRVLQNALFLFFEFTISANLAISAWLTWCMYAVGHSMWVLQCICVCALICRRYMLPHGCYICVHIASLSVFDIHIWWFDRSDMLFYCTEAHRCMCRDIERC